MFEGIETFRYKVKLVFTTRVLGTAPADKEVYREFILKKRKDLEERRAKYADRHETPKLSMTGTEVEELETVNEDAGVTVFHNDLGQTAEDGTAGRGLHFLDYQVGGYIKESAEILSQWHNIPQVRSKLDNFLMVEPRRIYITDETGKAIEKPDGKCERPLRAMTMQGPRVSLACSDIVNPGRRIEFFVDFLPYLKSGKAKEKKDVEMDGLVKTLFRLGARKGMGQWRNGGNGKFLCEVTRV